MCIIAFAYKYHPKYQLILLSNRDEFYKRKSVAAVWRNEYPEILAGKDLKSGGTWLGVTKSGKFAALTNYRKLPLTDETKVSRGQIVQDSLSYNGTVKEFCLNLVTQKNKHNPFNLIFGNTNSIFFVSSETEQIQNIESGIHTLSNASLNTPWFKTERLKSGLKKLCDENIEFSFNDGFKLLKDKTKAPNSQLPKTGINFILEKMLSSVFVSMFSYGTVVSTIITIDYHNNVRFEEQWHQPKKEINKFDFKLYE